MIAVQIEIKKTDIGNQTIDSAHFVESDHFTCEVSSKQVRVDTDSRRTNDRFRRLPVITHSPVKSLELRRQQPRKIQHELRIFHRKGTDLGNEIDPCLLVESLDRRK